MLGFVLNVVLAATLYDPHRLVVTDLKAEGIDAATASMLTALLAEALARDPRYSVRDHHDLATLLVHDREQQLVGCNDDGCFADISTFVGAESIVTGKIGKVGAELVLTVNRIDAARGQTVQRVVARAASSEAMGRELQLTAVKLLADKAAPKAAATKLGPDAVARLETHDDCHWAAVRLEDEPAQRQLYQAVFPATHFRFGRHEPLNELLLVDPSYWFLGDFHSCFPRDRADVDAFTMASGLLGVKADTAQAAALRQALDARQLELAVRFVITSAALTPGRAYDWENCESKTVKAFKASDVYPTARIQVVAATLRDATSGERYHVGVQAKKGGDVATVAAVE